MPDLTEQQRQAARALHSVAVTAGAGTGKTFVLAERYLYLLRECGRSPLEIVAVTFTRKAAAELRSRIRARVAEEFGSDSDCLAELEAAQISTFHTLAGRICREQAEVAGIPPDFQILDETEGQLWMQDQLDLAFDSLPEALFDMLPYSKLSSAIAALLENPLAAECALARSPEDWEPEFERARTEALRELLQDPEWEQATRVLSENSGKSGDKLETYRQDAVAAIAALRAGEEPGRWLRQISSLKINCGSRKNWDSPELMADIKAAIAAIRDLARAALAKGLVTLGERSDLEEFWESRGLPALRDAFDRVRIFLKNAKKTARILDYNDLELYALEALKDPDVRAYYHRRWKAYSIDEFQDTNPTQAELLDRLAGDASLTLVGDDKQSIYGFRGSDLRLFQNWRDRLAADPNGTAVDLTQSFRTHRDLAERVNQLCRPLLRSLHQDLQGTREPPDGGPHLAAFRVEPIDPPNGEEPPRFGLDDCRRVEAAKLAERVAALLTANGGPYEPGDIAVLARTWGSLRVYAEALEQAGVPAFLADSGNLLETRESLDATALLRFLADPSDSLALVAVLRSPFFALSDRLLYAIARRLPRLERSESPPLAGVDPSDRETADRETADRETADRETADRDPRDRQISNRQTSDRQTSATEGDPDRSEREPLDWWAGLQRIDWDAVPADEIPPADRELLHQAIATLRRLRAARTVEPPTRLLQQADRATGYRATLANLNDRDRRLSHWQGFFELVRGLERGPGDLFGTVRRLRRLAQASGRRNGNVTIKTPPLQATAAVTLMTLHGAKGLEWPVVFLPDLSREPPPERAKVYLDPAVGVAVSLGDSRTDAKKRRESSLFRLLERRQRERDRAEQRRLLYVGLTRARDRLVLSAASSQDGWAYALATEALAAAGETWTVEWFDPAEWVSAGAIAPVFPPPPDLADRRWVTDGVGFCADALPVTALTDYDRCPRRFAFAMSGHPGCTEDEGEGKDGGEGKDEGKGESGDQRELPDRARRVGLLTHAALERNLATTDALRSFDETLDPAAIAEALELANRFRNHPAYAPFRQSDARAEQPLQLAVVGMWLNGRADWVGADFVLDFKTVAEPDPERDRLQLWAYATALDKPRAAIAYLRQNRVDEFSRDRLAAEVEPRVKEILQGIQAGRLAATPSSEACNICPYGPICSDRAAAAPSERSS